MLCAVDVRTMRFRGKNSGLFLPPLTSAVDELSGQSDSPSPSIFGSIRLPLPFGLLIDLPSLLSIRVDALQIAVVVLGDNDRVFEFCNANIDDVIIRYTQVSVCSTCF